MSLFSGTGKEIKDVGNDVTREDYPKGNALYAFDLSPDLAEVGHVNLTKQETVRCGTQIWRSSTEHCDRRRLRGF